MSEKVHDLTEIALLSALITITGAIKLPSLLPGMEFQLSAPLAVAICVVFGFKKYILAGLLSSTAGLILGTHNLFNVAIAMQFRLVVGAMIALFGRRLWVIASLVPWGPSSPASPYPSSWAKRPEPWYWQLFPACSSPCWPPPSWCGC